MRPLEFFRCSAMMFAIVMLMTMAGEAAALTVTRGPYLQMGTSSGVIVRWRSDVASDSRVRVGVSPSELTMIFDDAAAATEHEVRVSGLTPQTRYYYSIGSTAQTLSGGDSNTYFHTAPVTGTPQPTRIWVIGDAGTGGAGQAAVYKAYRDYTGANPTHLWLQLGDNAYWIGTDAQYQSKMFNVYADLLRQSVTWPALGNHDGMPADSASQTGPYYEIFSLPRHGEAGGVASGTEAYYSFDYANIHFVVLDSHDTNRDIRDPMLRWLESDLRVTNADWIIAYWHHPPYSKGAHDSDTDSQLTGMRRDALPILERYGVDLVLTGHSHSYERSKFIDGHYGSSSTFRADVHVKQPGGGHADEGGVYRKAGTGMPRAGAVYAVAGSSGKLGGGSLDHPAMHVSLNELGSMALDVNDLTLDAKFIDSHGAVRDDFSIIKREKAAERDVDVKRVDETGNGTGRIESGADAPDGAGGSGDGGMER